MSAALTHSLAGKPLIISEFGEYRKPMKQRNAVFKTLYNELNRAKDQGLPVAGAGFLQMFDTRAGEL